MRGARLEWKPYSRPLKKPLVTAHGVWGERQGILLRLQTAGGRCGYGEIAPLVSFGTESMEEALRLLDAIPKPYGGLASLAMPSGFPSTEMGLWFAESMVNAPLTQEERIYPVAALLPAGDAAAEALRDHGEEGFRVFKWKVGVHSVAQELGWLNQLVEMLPPRARLRLDANRAFSREAWECWLDRLTDIPQIEFVEEPMSSADRSWMMQAAQERGIQVALDESVCSMGDLLETLLSGWQGLLVIKPSIIGSPLQYLPWQSRWNKELLFSSVFETAIGMEHALRLIGSRAPGVPQHALGFGTNRYFPDDGFSLHGDGPELVAGRVNAEVMEALWQMA